MGALNSYNMGDRSIRCSLQKVITDPSVGGPAVWQPAGSRIESLIQVQCIFTADATVIDRWLVLQTSHDSVAQNLGITSTAITASQTRTIHFAINVLPLEHAGYTAHWVPIPPDIYLDPLDSFAVSAVNQQAGDSITDIFVWYNQLFNS